MKQGMCAATALSESGSTSDIGCEPCIARRKGACGTKHVSCEHCEVIKCRDIPALERYLEDRLGPDYVDGQMVIWAIRCKFMVCLFCLAGKEGTKLPKWSRVQVLMETLPADKMTFREEITGWYLHGAVPLPQDALEALDLQSQVAPLSTLVATVAGREQGPPQGPAAGTRRAAAGLRGAAQGSAGDAAAEGRRGPAQGSAGEGPSRGEGTAAVRRSRKGEAAAENDANDAPPGANAAFAQVDAAAPAQVDGAEPEGNAAAEVAAPLRRRRKAGAVQSPFE